MREDIYCAISTSIPSGQLSLLYPRQAVRTADLVPSVPNVATWTRPSSPRSLRIALKMAGRLEGAKSMSISFYFLMDYIFHDDLLRAIVSIIARASFRWCLSPPYTCSLYTFNLIVLSISNNSLYKEFHFLLPYLIAYDLSSLKTVILRS